MKTQITLLALALSLNSFSMVELDPMTRQEIVDYAKTALGVPYVLGGSSWLADQQKGAVDCTGVLQKAWRWPVYTKPEEKMKGIYKIGTAVDESRVTLNAPMTHIIGKLHSSVMTQNPIPMRLFNNNAWDNFTTSVTFPWSINAQFIDFNDVKKGDGFAKYYAGDSTGHVFLVDEVLRSDLLLSVEAVKPVVTQLKRSIVTTLSRKFKHLKRENITEENQSDAIVGPITNPSIEDLPAPLTDIEPMYYTVKSSDTLAEIAQYFETTLDHIIKLNPQIKNINLIYVGQKIRVK